MRSSLHRALRCPVHPLFHSLRFTSRQIATARATAQRQDAEGDGSAADPQPQWPLRSKPGGRQGRRQPDNILPTTKPLPSTTVAARWMRAIQDQDRESSVRRQDFKSIENQTRASRLRNPWDHPPPRADRAASTNAIRTRRRKTSYQGSAVRAVKSVHDQPHGSMASQEDNAYNPRSRTDIPFYDVDWRPLIGSHGPPADMPKYLELTLVCDPFGLPPSIYAILVHLGLHYQNQQMIHRLAPKLKKQLRRVKSLLIIRPMSETKMRIEMRKKKEASARKRPLYVSPPEQDIPAVVKTPLPAALPAKKGAKQQKQKQQIEKINATRLV